MDNLIIVDRLTISTSVYNRIDPWNLISRENAKSGVVNESGREGIPRCSVEFLSGAKIVPINQGPLSFAQEEFNRPFIPLPW